MIRVEELVKYYGPVMALKGISFEVRKGEVFAFLGPNGAGKTTTVEILECLRRPSDGRAEVLGHDVLDPRGQEEIKKRIGVLPQDFHAFDLLTVKENLEYFSSMYEGSNCDIEGLLKMVGLEGRKDDRYKILSGGLKKRVGIAIALVNDPELIFLDEPTAGLDPRARREVWSVIEELRSEGKTIFLTTHYMEEAQRLADRVCIIDDGKIIDQGTPHELIGRYGGSRVLVLKGRGLELAKKVGLEGREEGDQVRLSLDERSLRDVLGMLSKSEIVVEGLEIISPTLEDVFLKLTGRSLAQEGVEDE